MLRAPMKMDVSTRHYHLQEANNTYYLALVQNLARLTNNV